MNCTEHLKRLRMCNTVRLSEHDHEPSGSVTGNFFTSLVTYNESTDLGRPYADDVDNNNNNIITTTTTTQYLPQKKLKCIQYRYAFNGFRERFI